MTIKDQILKNRNRDDYDFSKVDELVISMLTDYDSIIISIGKTGKKSRGEISISKDIYTSNKIIIIMDDNSYVSCYTNALIKHFKTEGLTAAPDDSVLGETSDMYMRITVSL